MKGEAGFPSHSAPIIAHCFERGERWRRVMSDPQLVEWRFENLQLRRTEAQVREHRGGQATRTG